ncbi:ATP-binding protein [Trinickia mobilis]|uniref:ATP-binding protein n=1 Tax=Trinickia mobilis TaxID=2816356 RepID=UPI001A8EBDC6|nr:ATP-binding protein [Trinickia mobilis]
MNNDALEEPVEENVENENANEELTPEQLAAQMKAQKKAKLKLIRKFQQHPINNHASGERLWTKPVDELNKVIHNAVLMRRSGSWVPASPGDGKTSAVIAVTDALEKEFDGEIAIVRLNYVGSHTPTIRGFHIQFLAAAGIADTRGETPALRLRLTNALIDKATAVGDNAVYLFIDEAQQMRDLEMRFLKDLSNELEMEGVQLVTFLFGQNPELSDAVARLKREGGFDLVSRFACREVRLRSYSTLGDFVDLLDKVDQKLDDDGVPYTAFFLPEAFSNGFRLKNEAKRFFAALRGSMNNSEHLGYPARQVFFALQDFLGFQAKHDAPDFKGTRKKWDAAVSEANMRIALEHKRDTPSAQTGFPPPAEDQEQDAQSDVDEDLDETAE